MDRGAWQAAVHGVVRSRTQQSDFPFTFHFHALEKEMAAHSSVLAWRIPGTGAWWAAVRGVTQSWTRLKRLSSSSSSSSLFYGPTLVSNLENYFVKNTKSFIKLMLKDLGLGKEFR